MIITPGFVGIDVSKHHLDIFDAHIGKPERIDNSPEALADRLAPWRQADVFVLFEATGRYDQALARALDQAAIPFARVNPARARDFARAAGFLAKTDAVDARMLAAMAMSLQPAPTPRPSPDRERLNALHRRRDQLVETRKGEKIRAKDTVCDEVDTSLARHIAWLDHAIEDLDQRIDRLLAESDELRPLAKRLRSIPGIGPVAATVLLGLVPELGTRTPKTVAALAGLAPINADSGQKRGARIIRGGRKRVRDALYMAAIAAIRCAPRFKAFYDDLRARGKPFKLAIIAVARKLIITANACIRDQKDFAC